MNNNDKVLSLLSMAHWLSMREIQSSLPEANPNSIRDTVFTLRKKTLMRTRAKRGKNGGLVSNSYQYSITEQGIEFLYREKKTILFGMEEQKGVINEEVKKLGKQCKNCEELAYPLGEKESEEIFFCMKKGSRLTINSLCKEVPIGRHYQYSDNPMGFEKLRAGKGAIVVEV